MQADVRELTLQAHENPLQGEPYVGARLDPQLDDQARIFPATAEENRLDRADRCRLRRQAIALMWKAKVYEGPL